MASWLDPLFPLRCASCAVLADDRLCPRCAPLDPILLPGMASGDGSRGAAPRAPEGLRWALAPAAYEGGLAAALGRAKYQPDRALACWLARRFAEHAAPAAVGFDWLVPVPSPWMRRAARGFACSALLAHELSRRSGVPERVALALAS